MRISTVVLGKAVRNAGISGRHVITKLMRKIQSIGQNIERWERDEVQIPGTKIALERAILDALGKVVRELLSHIDNDPLQVMPGCLSWSSSGQGGVITRAIMSWVRKQMQQVDKTPPRDEETIRELG
jgi:hypothetical protein